MVERLRWLVLAAIVFVAVTRAEFDLSELAAVVEVHEPLELRGGSLGYRATFSKWPVAEQRFRVWTPPAVAVRAQLGCGDVEMVSKDVPQNISFLAVVRRGNCSYVDKAIWATKVGASGVIVASDSEDPLVMSVGNSTIAEGPILMVSVSLALGQRLLAAGLTVSNGTSDALLSFRPYRPSVIDIAEGCLILLATVLVVFGALFSTSDLRQSSLLAPSGDEVVEIDSTIALGFCIMGSCMLVILFYFMKFMIYFLMFGFCVGGASCVLQMTSMFLQYFNPSLKRAIIMPLAGPVAVSDFIASVPALSLVVCWMLFRNSASGWLFQDMIGAGFLCMMQRTLRLPNMQVATLLLSVMFCFDVFWVFISPLLFTTSVMVEVAQGGGTGEAVPMLLRIPAFSDALGRDRMLGFGDVALPGLLVSYLLRFDLVRRKRLIDGYFLPSVLGYFIGLIATVYALVVTRMGQPALLYLVPCTLGTTLLLAWHRGELSSLWVGVSAAPSSGILGRDHQVQEIDLAEQFSS